MAILNYTSTSVETEPRKPPKKPAKPPMAASRAMGAGWTKRDTVLILLVLLLAGGLRILRLAEPNAVVFDETYYAKDACLYLGYSQQFCGLEQATEQSYVHPPLGKWLISLGISAFGYNSFGWRFSGAVFGTAMAGLAFILTRKLFQDRWTAAVAGLLVAADFLLIVQSRIAMLDIFVAFFILLGFWFLVQDRSRVLAVKDALAIPHPDADRVRKDVSGGADPPKGAIPAEISESPDTVSGEPAKALPPPDDGRNGKPPARTAWWRVGAGAAFGLAVAVKWSAVLALAAAAVCSFFWSLELLIAARKRRGDFYGPPRSASLARECWISVSAFLLIPILVYAGAYAGYFIDRYREDCPFTVPADPERAFNSQTLRQPEGRCIDGVAGTALSFADLQDRMLDYHSNLTAKHSYQSKAWTWPLLLRPVAYFYESEDGKATEVMALGSPAAWYGWLLALFWLVFTSRKSWRPERLVLVAWGMQYIPWLLVSRPLFLFYMTPAVPFMMIGLAAGLGALRRQGGFGRFAVWGFLGLSASMLIVFYPVLAAIPLPQEWWERLMWIPHFDCGGFMCGWI